MDDGQKMGTTYSTEKQNVSLAEQCVTNIQIYSNIFYRYWIFEYKYWINTKKLPYSIRMFNYSNNYTNFNHLFMKYSNILSYLSNIRFFSILVFVFDQNQIIFVFVFDPKLTYPIHLYSLQTSIFVTHCDRVFDWQAG